MKHVKYNGLLRSQHKVYYETIKIMVGMTCFGKSSPIFGPVQIPDFHLKSIWTTFSKTRHTYHYFYGFIVYLLSRVLKYRVKITFWNTSSIAVYCDGTKIYTSFWKNIGIYDVFWGKCSKWIFRKKGFSQIDANNFFVLYFFFAFFASLF